jgi:single-strand DNA-binding protein
MNKVILMGRLTKEPVLRYLNNQNSTPVCRFTTAVDRRFQKPGEERKADFIPIVAYGKTGEFTSKYFSKGARVAVIGSIQIRSWDDETGVRHFATDIIAEEAYFADGKKEGQEQNGDAYEGNLGYYPLEED